MLDYKELTEKRRMGPPTKKFLDAYPGDEVIIDMLKTKYGFEYEQPRKLIRYDHHGNIIDDAENFFKNKKKDNPEE